VQLPPYHPELASHWTLPSKPLALPEKPHWSNRAYDKDGALEEAAMAAWQQSALDTELMQTVCNALDLKSS
jgi:hypothetical protein